MGLGMKPGPIRLRSRGASRSAQSTALGRERTSPDRSQLVASLQIKGNAMSATERPVQDIGSLLEQKIEEAELDLSDVQVHDVIMALCDVLARQAKMTVELLERARRVKRGKLSINQLEAWVEEQDSIGHSREHFTRLLLKADADLEDEAVIAAMAVVRDVWIYAGNVFDSVFETLEQQ
jgi:hypothetical protein